MIAYAIIFDNQEALTVYAQIVMELNIKQVISLLHIGNLPLNEFTYGITPYSSAFEHPISFSISIYNLPRIFITLSKHYDISKEDVETIYGQIVNKEKELIEMLWFMESWNISLYSLIND